MSSSDCARRVDRGGVFLRIGPASRTIVWMGFGGGEGSVILVSSVVF